MSGSASAPRKKSMWWQAGPFEQWVKEVLISVLVPQGSAVCELMCGSGKDLGKWQRAKPSKYVGIDPQEHATAKAKQQWEGRKRPFPAQFSTADPYQRSLSDVLARGQMFDAVACFGKLQACFVREATTRMVLKNAAAHLNDGGHCFGFVPDSSHIWTKAQQLLLNAGGCEMSGAPNDDSDTGSAAKDLGDAPTSFELKRELYSLAFRDDTFPVYGCSYELHLAGQPDAAVRKDYLVHFPTLVNVAREYGLQMIHISNFKDFFEASIPSRIFGRQLILLAFCLVLQEYRALFGRMLVNLQVLENEKERSLDKQQRELIELYAVFVFKKVARDPGEPGEKAKRQRPGNDPCPE